MKTFIFILALSSIVASTQQTQNSSKLQQQVDSLKNQLAASYKPGFGEFMGSIQTHLLSYGFREFTRTGNLPILKCTK